MQTAALVIGWVLICMGILAMFIPDYKTDTVNGEKDLLKEKEDRTRDFSQNFADAGFWSRKGTDISEEEKTRE